MDSIYISKNNKGTSLLEKKRLPLLFLCIIIPVIWYVTIGCELRESYDLNRYYSGALLLKDASFSDIFDNYISRSNDFIYYIILHCAVLLSLPLNLVTVIIVTIYYLLIISCMKDIYRGRIEWSVIITVLFLVPMIWVISISRNLTAIMFLYIAVKMYYKKKWVLMLLFASLSVFTHFSTLMYVAVLVLSYLFRKTQINKWVVAVIASVLMVVSLIIPSYLIDILGSAVSGSDTIYGIEYTDLQATNMWVLDSVGYGDKLPGLSSLIFSIILLLNNNKQGFEYWMLFMLTIMLSFFLNSSPMFTNRCMMVMPMFWGLNVASIYNFGSENERKIIKYFSIYAILVIILHVWAYRPIYLAFLFH